MTRPTLIDYDAEPEYDFIDEDELERALLERFYKDDE